MKAFKGKVTTVQTHNKNHSRGPRRAGLEPHCGWVVWLVQGPVKEEAYLKNPFLCQESDSWPAALEKPKERLV